MITIGSSERFLVPARLEALLTSVHSANREQELLDTFSIHGGACFDFSLVEWVDPGTLVQLVALIEAMLRRGLHIEIRRPYPKQTGNETAAGVLIRRDRRRIAANTLVYYGFEQSITHEHMTKLRGTARFVDEQAPQETVAPDFDTPEQELPAPLQREHHFPLTWLRIRPRPHPEIRNVAEKMWTGFVAALGEESGLASIFNVHALSDVVMEELIENVLAHADSDGWALVGGCVHLHPATLREEWFLSCDQDFLSWYRQIEQPMIELYVGDSGIGIRKTLAQHLPISESEDTPDILQRAYRRYIRRGGLDKDTTQTGLYRVDRLANNHSGMAAVRSDDGYAGWDHGGAAFDAPVAASETLTHIPGCIHRVRIPLTREVYRQRKPAERTPNPPAFEIMGLTPNGQGALDDEVLLEMKQRFAARRPQEFLCLLAPLLIQFEPPDYKVFAENVLNRLAEVPDLGVIVVYGLPGGKDLLDSLIAASQVELGGDEPPTTAPRLGDQALPKLLVLGEQTRGRWYGGCADVCRILDELISSGRRLDDAELRSLVRSRKRREGALQVLLRAGHLVVEEQGALQLRFSLSDLWREVAQGLGQRIDALLEQWTPNNAFRSPSLVLLRKWLRVEDILPDPLERAKLSLALALKVREHPAFGKIQDPSALLVDTGTSNEDYHAFAYGLGIKSRIAISGDAGDSDETLPNNGRLVDAGQHLVVFNEFLYSGETVQRFGKQALQDGAHPILIAAYIDARKEKTDSMRVFGREIPVISLHQVDLVLDEPDDKSALDIANINPIVKDTESELADIAFEPTDLERTTPLDDVLVDTEALHLGHFGEPGGRHFTFFLNPHQLMRSPVVRSRYQTVIERWADDLRQREPEVSVSLLYPESTHEAAVQALCNWLRTQNPELFPAEPLKVPRQRVNEQFKLLAMRRGAPRRHIVLVDWGAVTGTTQKQMLRIAAQLGAERVLSCVYVSQLNLEDEQFFQMVSTLDANRTALSTRPTPDRRVEVQVRILERFQFGKYSKGFCPVCTNLVAQDQLRRRGHLPPLINDHLVAEQERLAIRSRINMDATARLPRPVGVDTAGLIWMVKVRSYLTASAGFTEARQEMVEVLTQVLGEFAEQSETVSPRAVWLMLLFAYEGHWMRRPPLHFEQPRQMLSDIALSIIRHPQAKDHQKIPAITVLRSAGKQRFAEHFRELFALCHDSPETLAPLLTHAYSYITRPYHQVQAMLKPLYHSLEKTLGALTRRELSVTEETRATLDRMRLSLERRIEVLNVVDLTPVQAWSKLRSRYEYHYDPAVAHRRLADEFGRLMVPASQLERMERMIDRIDIGTPPQAEDLKFFNETYFNGLIANWESCRSFLDRELLPLVLRIAPTLKGYDARTTLTPQNINRLLEIAGASDISEELEIAGLIAEFAAQPATKLTWENWQRFREEHGWLNDMVFRYDRETGDQAMLHDLILSAPQDFGEVLSGIWPQWRAQWEKEMERIAEVPEGLEEILKRRLQVFLPFKLLQDLIWQILGNILKHRIPGEIPHIWLTTEAADEETQKISFLNTGTGPSIKSEKDQGGYGLSSTKERLSAFGGEIRIDEARRHGEENATFRVDVYLKLAE
ncbi:ATP-binding protein [Endothiovibrio diazotrophicus]